MNNPSLARTLAGVGVIGIGVLALLGSLQIINFSDLWSTWWPVIFIAAGALMFVGNQNGKIGPTFFVLAGTAILLNNLAVFDFNVYSLFWPLVIILVGWSILRQGHSKVVIQSGDDNYFAMMSGTESRNTSKDYKGGKVTAIMGGVDIDLRNAVIKKNATLEVFALMGGVEVKVPRGWVVKSQAVVFLGGIENKADDVTKSDAPTLTLVGNVVMGGVEVKY
jgi:predicted membrane protein